MRVKILANPRKDWAKQVADQAKIIIRRAGHHMVAKGADATICIGGDGTILYAGHRGRLEGAVLGIGGKTSYICQLRKYNWKRSLVRLLEKGKKQKVMTLSCSIAGRRFTVINDVVVHATNYRVATMQVAIGKKTREFEGDGVIISTALGSAAYAYSAGARKMRPTERKISVAPICPYRRAFSSAVLPQNQTVGITVGSDCAFIMDGIFIRRLRKGERVVAGKGADMMLFEGAGKWD
jgi:NAD+ kinase